MMKSIYKLTFSFLLIAGLLSCDEENGRTVFEGPYYTQFTTLTLQIEEGAGGTIEVPVSNVGPTLNQDIVINYTIDPASTAVEGVDFEIEGTMGQVTIPSGQHFGAVVIKPIDDLALESDKTIILKIGDNNAGLEAGRGAIGVKSTITIVDDDCEVPDILGTFNSVVHDTSPAGCDGVTATVTISKVSDNPDGTITYMISDITGGLYENCYGDGANPGNFDVDGRAITITDQPDVVYGGDIFNGSGSINCDGSLVMTWGNGYGDKGTTTLTR